MRDRIWWIIGFVITLGITIFMMVMKNGEFIFEGVFILSLMLIAAPAIWARTRDSTGNDDSDKKEK